MELRPLAARLEHSARSVRNFLKPGPQPELSLTVESPTNTNRIFLGISAARAVDGFVPNASSKTAEPRESAVNRSRFNMRLACQRISVSQPFSGSYATAGELEMIGLITCHVVVLSAEASGKPGGICKIIDGKIICPEIRQKYGVRKIDRQRLPTKFPTKLLVLESLTLSRNIPE